MTTVQEQQPLRGSLSNDAYELIQRYYDGVDVVVRTLAEEIAEARGSFLEDEPGVVAIEVEDVQEAGRRVIESLKELLEKKQLPAELENALADMQHRLKHEAT